MKDYSAELKIALEKAQQKIALLEHENFILQTQIEMKSNHLDLLLKKAPIILFSIDANGFFEYAYGSALKQINKQAIDFVGHSIYELYNRNHPIITSFQKALSNHHFSSTIPLNKTKFFNIHFAPVISLNEEIIRIYLVAVFIDSYSTFNV